MTAAELYGILKKIGIPIAYGAFSEEQAPPYAVYYRERNENITADDRVYYFEQSFVLEVYVSKRSLSLENKIDTLFSDNDIPYEADEVYLPDEKLRMITYEFSV